MNRALFAYKVVVEPASNLAVGDLVRFVADPDAVAYRVTDVLPDGLVRLVNVEGGFSVGRAAVTELATL